MLAVKGRRIIIVGIFSFLLRVSVVTAEGNSLLKQTKNIVVLPFLMYDQLVPYHGSLLFDEHFKY